MNQKFVIVLVFLICVVVPRGGPAFEPPELSQLPDIVVSDLDRHSLTPDDNVFVFSNALNLDEYVADPDTDDAAIRWSFFNLSDEAIRLNGIGSNTSGDVLNPGAFDVRAISPSVTVENVLWSGTEGSTPSMTSVLEIYASDGDAVASQSILVTTVNNRPNLPIVDDALVAPALRAWTFEGGDDGWRWFEIDNEVFEPPLHSVEGGALVITKEPGGPPQIVFGSWESPVDPAAAIRPAPGRVLRVRYFMRSEAETPAATPGFRFRGIITHTTPEPVAEMGRDGRGGRPWRPDFGSLDFLDNYEVLYPTYDKRFIPSRVPGPEGQVYTMLLYPEQVLSTLLSTDTVTYVTADMLDTEIWGQDAGSLFVDVVEVDSFVRPEIGTGTPVEGLTTSSFAGNAWAAGSVGLWTSGTPHLGGLMARVTSGALSISVLPGNAFFHANIEMRRGLKLQPEQYYRLVWTLNSTGEGRDKVTPLVRTALASKKFAFAAVKELRAGSLYARLDPTPRQFEMWVAAPTADSTADDGLTEPMVPRFESWQLASRCAWPVQRVVAGSVHAKRLFVEYFAPPEIPGFPAE